MSDKKELIEFPCTFPIKVMGLATLAFETAALAIVHKHYPDMTETAIQQRYSKDKKYLAITFTIEASSQDQLDAIYQELSNSSEILMAL